MIGCAERLALFIEGGVKRFVNDALAVLGGDAQSAQQDGVILTDLCAGGTLQKIRMSAGAR